MKVKTTKERGQYKQKINAALYKSESIKSLLFDGIDTTGMSASELRELFKKHVKSHLFIDDTIKETDSYIFYDVRMLYMRENIKDIHIVIYAICHRDILDNYTKDGYFGNRADILSEMIEDCLLNDEDVVNSFGIGKLFLDSVDIYNSTRFYGCIMTFNVPDFR
jgi:hypothetical protein